MTGPPVCPSLLAVFAAVVGMGMAAQDAPRNMTYREAMSAGCDVLPWTQRPSRNPPPYDPMKRVLKKAKEGGKIPASKTFIEEEVSRVVTHPRPEGIDTRQCCWDRFQIAYDANGDPLVVSISNFLCDPEEFVRKAIEAPRSAWPPADIHENNDVDDPMERKLRGNGFPGLRFKQTEVVESTIKACMEHAVKTAWPDFSWDRLIEHAHEFGLVSSERQPGGAWLDSQRLPHNDIKWKYGVRQDKKGSVPQCLATVFGLTDSHDMTGTALFRSNGTKEDRSRKLSLLKTLEMNEMAQGSMNPHKPLVNMNVGIDVREEIPDPYPQSITSNAWAEAIMITYLRFNRVSIYDGRRLHNQYMHKRTYTDLSLDPRKGRLTMNSFYWQSAEGEDRYHRRKHPEQYD